MPRKSAAADTNSSVADTATHDDKMRDALEIQGDRSGAATATAADDSPDTGGGGTTDTGAAAPTDFDLMRWAREQGFGDHYRDGKQVVETLHGLAGKYYKSATDREAEAAELRAEIQKLKAQGATTQQATAIAKEEQKQRKLDIKPLPNFDERKLRYDREGQLAIDDATRNALEERNRALLDRSVQFFNDPVGSYLDPYMEDKLPWLQEQIKSVLQTELRPYLESNQAEWYIARNREWMVDEKTRKPTEEGRMFVGLMDRYQEAGLSDEHSRAMAERDLQIYFLQRQLQGQSKGTEASAAPNGASAKEAAEKLRQQSIEQSNRKVNRNGSVPRGSADPRQGTQRDLHSKLLAEFSK